MCFPKRGSQSTSCVPVTLPRYDGCDVAEHNDTLQWKRLDEREEQRCFDHLHVTADHLGALVAIIGRIYG